MTTVSCPGVSCPVLLEVASPSLRKRYRTAAREKEEVVSSERGNSSVRGSEGSCSRDRMHLRLSLSLGAVTRRSFKAFHPPALKLEYVPIHLAVGTQRVLQSKSSTTSSEARILACLGKVSGSTEKMNSENPPLPSKLETQKKLREIVAGGPSGWDECWKEGVTPWDMGSVTPIIQHIVEQGQVPEGRILVPGCGSGYDVLAMASETRFVVGMDISETAIARAKKLASEEPRGKWVQFLLQDFFSYKAEAAFGFIFDYTFFCALDPSLRPLWAAKMAELLSPDGELLTLMFPIDEYEGGPPFAVSVQAYEAVLNPLGLVIVSCENSELSFPVRKSREKVARWRRTSSKI
ncbi:hypothetical protein R1flu_015184 [Riccia fluitans]|uniref:Thiol methyltransferase 2 n=1 Tax=Riccia fluitans TaxID=41844 RepID=A0ABD1YI72_9MARC